MTGLTSFAGSGVGPPHRVGLCRQVLCPEGSLEAGRCLLQFSSRASAAPTRPQAILWQAYAPSGGWAPWLVRESAGPYVPEGQESSPFPGCHHLRLLGGLITCMRDTTTNFPGSWTPAPGRFKRGTSPPGWGTGARRQHHPSLFSAAGARHFPVPGFRPNSDRAVIRVGALGCGALLLGCPC